MKTVYSGKVKMKTDLNVPISTLLLIAGISLGIVGCASHSNNSSVNPGSAATPTSTPKPPPVASVPWDTTKSVEDTGLVEGKPAYLRVQEYEAGKGVKLKFGDQVTLSKKSGDNWKATFNGKTYSIASFNLTGWQAEIDYLERANTIPSRIMCLSWEKSSMMADNQELVMGMTSMFGGSMHSVIRAGSALVLRPSITTSDEGRKQAKSTGLLKGADGSDLPIVANAIYYCTKGSDSGGVGFKLIDPRQ